MTKPCLTRFKSVFETRTLCGQKIEPPAPLGGHCGCNRLRIYAPGIKVAPMNKLLLATALVIAFSLPALAVEDKSQIRPKHRYVGSTSDHQFKSGKARRKPARGEGSDPYWTPCDYSTAWGPNGCGGD